MSSSIAQVIRNYYSYRLKQYTVYSFHSCMIFIWYVNRFSFRMYIITQHIIKCDVLHGRWHFPCRSPNGIQCDDNEWIHFPSMPACGFTFFFVSIRINQNALATVVTKLNVNLRGNRSGRIHMKMGNVWGQLTLN